MKQLSNEAIERGVSIYLAFMLMAMLLALALGVSTILVSELKMTTGIGYSVIAFHAADTGIERILYDEVQCRQQEPPCSSPCKQDIDGDGFCDGLEDSYEPSETLSNAAQYKIQNIADGFRAVGVYKGTRRAIEIIY